MPSGRCYDYGFRAVIAPSFGDIFYSNSLKNGLLPIILPEPSVAAMLEAIQTSAGHPHRRRSRSADGASAPDGTSHAFSIDGFSKHCLLNGLDELSYTLSLVGQIADFERRFEQADC